MILDDRVYRKYAITNVSYDQSYEDVSIYHRRPHPVAVGTLSISMHNEGVYKLLSDISKLATEIDEEKLREKYPSLKEAWENYQTVLGLVRDSD